MRCACECHKTGVAAGLGPCVRCDEPRRPPGPEYVPPIGDEPGVWIFWPAHRDGRDGDDE